MLKSNLKLFSIVVFGMLFAGCSTGKAVLKKDNIVQVKKVAVVLYTTPLEIEQRDNPRKTVSGSDSSLWGAVKELARAAGKGDGPQAATLAHESFSEALNRQGLSFEVMTQTEMRANKVFTDLYSPPAPPKEKETESVGSFLKSTFLPPKGPKFAVGAAPAGFNQYGLIGDWNQGSGLLGTLEEKKYIMDAIKALNVDAAIVINDPGYSFVCKACIGGTGSASTGSAFTTSMVSKDGDVILDMREWFAYTEADAIITSYIVNPLQTEKLFKEHGRKMAIVFADFLKKSLNETK